MPRAGNGGDADYAALFALMTLACISSDGRRSIAYRHAPARLMSIVEAAEAHRRRPDHLRDSVNSYAEPELRHAETQRIYALTGLASLRPITTLPLFQQINFAVANLSRRQLRLNNIFSFHDITSYYSQDIFCYCIHRITTQTNTRRLNEIVNLATRSHF